MTFRSRGASLGTASVAPPRVPWQPELCRFEVAVPAAVGEFDELWLDTPLPLHDPAAACVARIEL